MVLLRLCSDLVTALASELDGCSINISNQSVTETTLFPRILQQLGWQTCLRASMVTPEY